MKVLLTGAVGFIGSHITRELVRQGHEVHALDLPGVDRSRVADVAASLRFVEADLLAPSVALPDWRYDLCIHLAWFVVPGKYLHSPENQQWIDASLRLARRLRDEGCQRFVAAGTCFEYATSDPPQSESTPTGPTTIYAQSKLGLFRALPSVGIDFAWVRFFYQYGPYEDPRRLVPVVINRLLGGEEAKLVTGDRIRDYLHIADVASAVCAVAQSQLTGAVNIGSGVPLTTRDLALKIGELLGRVDLIKLGAYPEPPTEPMHLLADNRKLCGGTTWKPRYDLDSGLRQTIDWWKSR
ncbi:MAG TPA: NAD(P)-dependent oxidoreductase [Verrucomicrobiae bacterium]|nr:NAD(P)-dependent oxidoreductase [Verrucomicrobiae bacterium]